VLFRSADAEYTHHYYVDGSPILGDVLFSPSDWHSVVIGSTGAGGKSYFALDVEDPASFNTSDVLWEATGDIPGDFENLGVTIGQATIARMHNGEWAAIFANGYNSSGGESARLFIVNAKTGALLKEIDTGASAGNGLSTPLVIDLDQDGTADYAYAGDLKGNLWKFDLSGDTASEWKVGLSGAPLLVAKNASNQIQPITAKPQAARHPDNGVMVYVGTGKFLESGDRANMNVQSFYGVHDNDVDANTGRNNLVAQTLTEDASSQYRFVSFNAVNYTGADAKRGFYIDLQAVGKAATGERVLSVPQVMSDRVIFNTMLATSDGGGSCSGGGIDGWLMEVDPYSGARTAESVFDLNDDGLFDPNDYVSDMVVNGVRIGSGGGPVILCNGDKCPKYVSVSKGADGLKQIDNRPPPSGSAGRQSWMQFH
jgi:type IV pilus assembly protein PilY1